jgi:hypothetical protein
MDMKPDLSHKITDKYYGVWKLGIENIWPEVRGELRKLYNEESPKLRS